MVENVFDAEFVMSSHGKFIKETTTAEKEQPADNEELLEVSKRLIDQNRNAYDDLAAQGQLRGKG